LRPAGATDHPGKARTAANSGMLEAIKLWGYSDIILPGRSDVVQLTAPIAPDAAAFLSRRIGYNPSLVPVDYQHFLGDRESRLRSLHNGQKRAVLGLHDIFNTGLAGHRVFSHRTLVGQVSGGTSADRLSASRRSPVAAPRPCGVALYGI
jgi:hypothetical protein